MKYSRNLGFVSPSGAGKTTIVNYIAHKYGFQIAKSHSTRKPRYETEQEYIFDTIEEFTNLEQSGYFFETEYLFGNYYGTPNKYIINNDIPTIFNIDIKGIAKLKSKLHDLICIMVLPPSIESLKQRILIRDGTHCDSRINRIKEELQFTPDFFIINDKLEETYVIVDELITMINYQIFATKKSKELLNSLKYI